MRNNQDTVGCFYLKNHLDKTNEDDVDRNGGGSVFKLRIYESGVCINKNVFSKSNTLLCFYFKFTLPHVLRNEIDSFGPDLGPANSRRPTVSNKKKS